ncbi:MAG TPA: BON domain-containing protein [Candidatus Limnocylindrales bacterium]|nr:BON domain-containing protein [Candidatus Limnocylindrales bacterium]
MRRYLLGFVLGSLALLGAGCSRNTSRPDAQIAQDVQSKINTDSAVPDKQVTINSTSGVVTLSGNVSSDAARNAAANDAAQIEGVKTVVNNLQVAPTSAGNEPMQNPADQQAQQQQNNAPPAREERSRPSPKRSHSASSRNSDNGDNGLRTTVPPSSTASAPPPGMNGNSSNGGSSSYDNTANNTPPPPPVPQPITIPSGTQLSIRLNDTLDSEKSQVGDTFHGSISSPVVVEGKTVIPTTADVEGRVVDVKSAGRFAGQSDLVIELTRIMMNGKSYSIQTDRWSKQGNGRGKATAAKVGGGAAVGAILGGIFGGGKGAAIGAAAGAGAGTGVSAATKGQQILLKPETMLSFQLQNSISVTPGANRQAMNQ